MTIAMLAFAAGLTIALALLLTRSDYRDQWAGAVVVMQTVLVWWQFQNLPAVAVFYAMASITFLVFSVRPSGAALGIVSGLLSLLTIGAALDWIPHETGQGIAPNYYHWATVLAWGQVGVLGMMAHGRNNLIEPPR